MNWFNQSAFRLKQKITPIIMKLVMRDWSSSSQIVHLCGNISTENQVLSKWLCVGWRWRVIRSVLSPSRKLSTLGKFFNSYVDNPFSRKVKKKLDFTINSNWSGSSRKLLPLLGISTVKVYTIILFFNNSSRNICDQKFVKVLKAKFWNLVRFSKRIISKKLETGWSYFKMVII